MKRTTIALTCVAALPLSACGTGNSGEGAATVADTPASTTAANPYDEIIEAWDRIDQGGGYARAAAAVVAESSVAAPRNGAVVANATLRFSEDTDYRFSEFSLGADGYTRTLCLVGSDGTYLAGTGENRRSLYIGDGDCSTDPESAPIILGLRWNDDEVEMVVRKGADMLDGEYSDGTGARSAP